MGNADALAYIFPNSRNSCHKCLARFCCCSNFDAGRFSFQLLLEDCQRTKEVGVDIPKPSVRSLFGDPDRTGHDSYERKTERFCGHPLQVC